MTPLTSSHIDEELLYDPWAGVINAARTGQFLKAFCERNIVKQAVKSIEITELGDAIVHSAQESWRCDSVIVLAGNATRALAATCGVETPIELERVFRFTFRMTNESAVLPCWFDEFDKWSTWGLTVRPGHWAIGIHWDGEPTQMSVSQEDSAAGVLSALRENLPQRMERLEQNPVDLIACVSDTGGDSMNAKSQGPVLAFWGDNQFKFAPVLGSRLAESAINQSLPNLPLTTSNN